MRLDLAIAQVLREGRLKRGLTQKELGYLTGLDPMTISRMERGTRFPSIQTLFLIAKALGYQPSALLARIEAMEPVILLQEDPKPYGKKGIRSKSGRPSAK